jgi:hypothetical protein
MSSSSEDEAEVKARMEHQKHELMKNRHKMAGGMSRSAHPSSLLKSRGAVISDKYGYESDGNVRQVDILNSTSASSTVPKKKPSVSRPK